MKKEVVAYRRPENPTSEKFRTLATNIQFMNTNKDAKTILITSTKPGEGKSWVAANLAITYAVSGEKVLLIDADMRKGRQFMIFGVLPRPGLSNFLSGVGVDKEQNNTKGIKKYIQKTDAENLSIITSGNVPPNPIDLLESRKLVNLLNNLKKEYDIIILDGTPGSLVMDTYILAKIVDSTVIVTAKNKVKKRELSDLIDNIKNVGGNIAGIVLNRKKGKERKKKESYYYGTISSEDIERYKLLSQENEIREARQREKARQREILRRKQEEMEKIKKQQAEEQEKLMKKRYIEEKKKEFEKIAELKKEKSDEIEVEEDFEKQIVKRSKKPKKIIEDDVIKADSEDEILEADVSVDEEENEIDEQDKKEQEVILRKSIRKDKDKDKKRKLTKKEIKQIEEESSNRTNDILKQINEYWEKDEIKH